MHRGFVALFARFVIAAQLVDRTASARHFLGRGEDAPLLVAVNQIVDPRHEGVGRAETHQREELGDADLEVEGVVVAGALPFGAQQAHHRQRRPLLAVVERLHGRQLHRLHARHDRTRAVARKGRHEGEDQSEDRRQRDAAARHAAVASAQQVPRAHAHDEDRRQEERRGDRMRELVDRHGREEYVPERIHLVAHRGDVERTSDGILHPAVGHQNPQRRKVGADGREPRSREVEAAAHLVPAEEHHRHEGRFEEEGHDPLDGQRRTEDVAHEVGVVRPVGAELEFENQSRGYADGEVDAEQPHPELRRAAPEGVARAVVAGLHQGAQDAQTERQRDEEPMVNGRQGELRPRPLHAL